MAITFTFDQALSRGLEQARLRARDQELARQGRTELGIRQQNADTQAFRAETDAAATAADIEQGAELNDIRETQAAAQTTQAEAAMIRAKTDQAALEAQTAPGANQITLPISEDVAREMGFTSRTIHRDLAGLASVMAQGHFNLKRAGMDAAGGGKANVFSHLPESDRRVIREKLRSTISGLQADEFEGFQASDVEAITEAARALAELEDSRPVDILGLTQTQVSELLQSFYAREVTAGRMMPGEAMSRASEIIKMLNSGQTPLTKTARRGALSPISTRDN